MPDAPNFPFPDGLHVPKARPATDEPGYVDGIAVEELVRMTREFTARITNEDRQRLALDLSESGHQRSIQSSAPYLLQQFFTGKIDLDVELARRYPSSPLLSSVEFTPEPGKAARHGFARFSSQDNAAGLSIEIHGASGEINVGFLLQSMIAVRFVLGAVAEVQRKRIMELLRRPSGIAFLWTPQRWERDYLIFVVRDHFARIYAFGPGRFDGACRLTPDGLDQLLKWLGALWMVEADAAPSDEVGDTDAEISAGDDGQDSPPSAFRW